MDVLDAKALRRLDDRQGMAIAARPTCKVAIKRGQSIARVVLLHGDSLRMEADHER